MFKWIYYEVWHIGDELRCVPCPGEIVELYPNPNPCKRSFGQVMNGRVVAILNEDNIVRILVPVKSKTW